MFCKFRSVLYISYLVSYFLIYLYQLLVSDTRHFISHINKFNSNKRGLFFVNLKNYVCILYTHILACFYINSSLIWDYN